MEEKKGESIVAENYRKIQKILYYMQAIGDYNDEKIDELNNEVKNIMNGLDEQVQSDRLMRFYLKCAEDAMKNKDAELLKELKHDWKHLKDFFWEKIEIDV